jgi:hypothetical protein
MPDGTAFMRELPGGAVHAPGTVQGEGQCQASDSGRRECPFSYDHTMSSPCLECIHPSYLASHLTHVRIRVAADPQRGILAVAELAPYTNFPRPSGCRDAD